MPGRGLIVIGPTPPPVHGSAFLTARFVEAVRQLGRLASHLDTSDDRPRSNIGQLDLTNVRLALLHSAQLALRLARHRAAVVHLPLSQNRWGFIRDASFIWLAFAARRRVIVYQHGGFFDTFYRRSGRALRMLIRQTMRRVDRAWVLTPRHESLFDGLLPRSRVHVIENACEDLGPPADRHVRDSRRPLRLLFLSSLRPEKGCLDLLDALETCGERQIHVRFVGEAAPGIAGEIARRAGLLAARGVRVEMRGIHLGGQKAADYRWADLFVFPTRYPYEGQPTVLLEAMSAGLPVVSTEHSGIPYTVRHGKEGLIVPVGDRHALTQAITRLGEDDELRSRLGAAGRKRYEARYRPERFNAAVEELLDLAEDGA